MEILFLILKIVGILLAVLLLLVFAVLAVPVRYGICMEAEDAITGKAVFSWFFRLVYIRTEYKNKDVAFQLRILGIPVSLDRRKKKAKTNNQKKSEKNHTDTERTIQEQQQLAPKVSENQDFSIPESGQNQRSSRKRNGPREWRRNVRAGFEALQQWFLDLKDKTITGKEKIQNIKNMISEETNKSAFLHLLREMKFLMRHFSPRKASGELIFGMEDPSRTGQVLGWISLFPFWANYRICVMPDFQAEKFYAKGSLKMKGHIRAWHMIWSVFRLIKDKNIRALITSFRT
ncbi:MAG: DUF2953 domain-containing protein [Lachnospiraceae bacterium]|nr:DUF2953 domain-containing protein [Lachnospiraceae bacterium]